MRHTKKVISYVLANEENHFMEFVCSGLDPEQHIYYEATLAVIEMDGGFEFNGNLIVNKKEFDEQIERLKNARL